MVEASYTNLDVKLKYVSSQAYYIQFRDIVYGEDDYLDTIKIDMNVNHQPETDENQFQAIQDTSEKEDSE